MAEWKITRRTGSCGLCERPFAEDERHVSALSVGDGGLTRVDACAGCWEARDGASSTEPLFWWTTRHLLARRTTVQLDLASLEELFVRLEGRAEPAVRELRYVLCLLLMRKRRLKLERLVRDAEGECLLVKRPRRDPRYRVFVFDFAPERVAELRAELQGIFEGAESGIAG